MARKALLGHPRGRGSMAMRYLEAHPAATIQEAANVGISPISFPPLGNYGRGMSHITTREGAVMMYKRTFKALLAASVVALAIPVSAVAMPTDRTGGPAVVAQTSAPIVSEKLAGLNFQGQRVSSVVSGTLDPWQQNLNAQAEYAQANDPWALNLFARQSHRDSGNMAVPSTVFTVSTGGFDWSDAGMGAASVFGVMLLGAASVATIRRHRGSIAH
jgi:hypothetical protein